MATFARSSPKARLKRLLRLIGILRSAEPKTAEELARLLGVSRRTVFRDLDLLSEAGIPYEYNRVTGARSLTSDPLAVRP